MSNRDAFIIMLTYSEGTARSPATQNEGWDVIITGADDVPEIFTDYSDHPFAAGRPPKVINSKGLESTASGGLQILLHEWVYYKKLLSLPDFSRKSQIAVGMQIIKERHALDLIDEGQFDNAVLQCSNIWASLPGNDYHQRQNRVAVLEKFYTDAGGVLLPPSPEDSTDESVA